jgi:hypothetical protein
MACKLIFNKIKQCLEALNGLRFLKDGLVPYGMKEI